MRSKREVAFFTWQTQPGLENNKEERELSVSVAGGMEFQGNDTAR
jgi:hypothetical protein